MKHVLSFASAFLLSLSVMGQGNIMLQVFTPLMDATWKAEGKWKDGKPFKQEIEYKWGPGEETVEMKTKSYLDTTFTDFGHFSDGVHQWDTLTNSITFNVKDIHNNSIEGTVVTKVKTIMYNYVYLDENDVKTYMTDALIWIKPDKYMFKVGTMEEGEWKEVYLETYFFKK